MIGTVTANREAVVLLRVQGESGAAHDFEGIIDTGFTDFLTLSPAVIASLALSLRGSTQVTLGDRHTAALNVYDATMLWEGQPRRVQALAADGMPLIGMSMLYGFRVALDVVDGGQVSIEALA